MKKAVLAALTILLGLHAWASRPINLSSPDGHITATIVPGDSLTYSVAYNGVEVLQPSTLSLTLSDGTKVGPGAKAKVSGRRTVDQTLKSPVYRASEIPEKYNELTLKLAKDWNVVFRAYDDGVAYRFVTTRKAPFEIADETACFRFPENSPAIAPYVNSNSREFTKQFMNSFENTYTKLPLDSLDRQRLFSSPW